MKKSLLFIILVLIIPCVLASNHINADFQIIENKVLVDLKIDNVDNLELKIPYNAEALEVNADYSLEKGIIKVVSAENLEIKYITDANIDKTGYKYYFVLKKQFTQPIDLVLYLPEGAILLEPEVVFPANPERTTDGRRIILSWNDLNEDILVSYGFIEEDNWHYLFIICVLILVIIGVYYWNKRKIKEIKHKSRSKKSKTKKEQDIMKNLYEDERKIVKYLLEKKKNEAWTKEIVKGVGISKVKLSRKLRSLEAKEVIKKIPYGNENRIRLLK